MSVRIRAAADVDIDTIASLETAALPRDAWSRGMIAEGVAGLWPTTRFRAAEHDGEVVGHVAVSLVDDLVELQRIVVRVDERRLGIGTALLSDATALAVADGAVRMLLEVREDNEQGRGFYDAQGFVEITRRPRYYRDGTTALVLEQQLPAERMDS